MKDWKVIQEKLTSILGYRFQDLSLMSLALTHCSYGPEHNERLEFLGDAVLGMLIAEELYARYPGQAEGQLSRARSFLVSGKHLAELSFALGLDQFIQVGNSERQQKKIQLSILANTFEAIVAAVYLDGGIIAAKKVVINVFSEALDVSDFNQVNKDFKTQLQELLQAQGLPLPIYVLECRTGKPHKQLFEISCSIKTFSVVALGKASSIRAAEQLAAKECLSLLNQLGENNVK